MRPTARSASVNAYRCRQIKEPRAQPQGSKLGPVAIIGRLVASKAIDLPCRVVAKTGPAKTDPVSQLPDDKTEPLTKKKYSGNYRKRRRASAAVTDLERA